MSLYFEEPLPDTIRWRLLRQGQELHFEARRLPAEVKSQSVSLHGLRQDAAAFSDSLDRLGDSLGHSFPPDLAQILRSEPVACWIAGETPWELARIGGTPLAYGRWVARPLSRSGHEVVAVSRPGERPRFALIHDGSCAPPLGLEDLAQHRLADFRAVLSSEDYAVVLASGNFEPFRSVGRHAVPRLLVLHGEAPEALTKALAKLGIDAMLITRWEIPWESCAAFVSEVFAQLREGARLGEAVGDARSKLRDPWRTDLALGLVGNPDLRLADLVPCRLELSRTRSAQVRPAYLIHVLEGPEAGKTIPLFAALLSAGRPLSVGGPGPHDNDIELEDDSVPCRTFWFEGQDGRLLVSGPVQVNGLPVPGKIPLEGGELLQVGQTLLRMEACGKPARPAGAPPRPDSLPAGSRYWLAQGERRFSLDRAHSLVGRAPDCDLVLEHDTVSRRHCLILRSGGHHVLRQLGGGLTLINGLVVEGETRLRDEDRLQFGEFAEWIFIDAGAGRAARNA